MDFIDEQDIPGLKLVRIAAKSPALAITAVEVARNPTSSYGDDPRQCGLALDPEGHTATHDPWRRLASWLLYENGEVFLTFRPTKSSNATAQRLSGASVPTTSGSP